MANMFFNLGKMLGGQARKANWLYTSLTGTEAEVRQAEAAIGRDLAQGVLQESELDPNPAVEPWLAELGQVLSTALPPTKIPIPFQFRGLLLNEANAFALPGGYIFVTRGLMQLCQVDQDEIGFVLAHEMAHVVLGHAIDRMMTQSLIQTAVSRWNPVTGILGTPLKGLLGLLLQQGYSQEQELQADQLGLETARKAGFDPRGARRLLVRLAELAPDGVSLGAYFSSHPPWHVRLRSLGI